MMKTVSNINPNAYPLERVLDKFSKSEVRIIPGGSVIDYVCAHLKGTGESHTQPDALRWLSNMLPTNREQGASTLGQLVRHNFRVMEAEALEDLALLRYLERLRIPTDLAAQILEEVYVRDVDTKRKFYALGIKNEDGGYAFCNPLIKGFAGAQTITFIRNRAGQKQDTVNVFVNFKDMLAAFTRFPETYLEQDSICLNDFALLPHLFAYITGYGYRHLVSWMSRYTEGQHAGEVIRRYSNTQRGLSFKSMTGIFQPHQTLIDWHIQTVDEG